MRQIGNLRLWTGHVGDLRDPQPIIDAGILAVVDLALEERATVLPRNLVYCRFPLIDGPGNSAALMRAAVETVACLLRLSTPTLICCGAGMSRSPCIAGAAIALTGGYAFDEGLKLVSSSGPIDISPGLWADIHMAFS
jgi:protein-tyrosine phosphatase